MRIVHWEMRKRESKRKRGRRSFNGYLRMEWRSIKTEVTLDGLEKKGRLVIKLPAQPPFAFFSAMLVKLKFCMSSTLVFCWLVSY